MRYARVRSGSGGEGGGGGGEGPGEGGGGIHTSTVASFESNIRQVSLIIQTSGCFRHQHEPPPLLDCDPAREVYMNPVFLTVFLTVSPNQPATTTDKLE